MTGDELREAAARALGREARPAHYIYGMGGEAVAVEADPPLEWTTAGVLLERCAAVEGRNLIHIRGNHIIAHLPERGGMTVGNGTKQFYGVTARNVIEACVMALGEVKG